MIIDTGYKPTCPLKVSKSEGLLFGVMDSLPENATQAQIDSALVEAIMGELREPRKMQTVRFRMLQLWSLIAPLAEREPEQFDAIFLEYLDRLDTLEG